MPTYLTRALQARDPRFAEVMGRLGYRRTDLVAEPAAVLDDTIVSDSDANASVDAVPATRRRGRARKPTED